MVHEDFIERNYEGYKDYLDSRKTINNPFVVSDVKENHPSSYYSETKLNSTYLFGDTYLSCEVKNSNVSDFSFAILSSLIPSRILYRFDSDGLQHRNKVDYIPLSMQSVPTPHYHQFDDKGNLLAYQTSDMADITNDSIWRSIDNAFDCICEMQKINSAQSDDKPKILLNTGDITFDQGDDPINGLNF